MHYLHWLVKAVVLGIIITWCAVSSAFSQNIQANIIDTAANPQLFEDGVVSSLYTDIRGFYKRDPVNHALNYSGLEKEMNSDFNNQPNILMVPVNIKKASS